MVRCPHPECSDSDKEFESDATMRQHHTKVHGERLPNSTCENCGEEFFRRRFGSYCDNCIDGWNEGVDNPNYRGKADYVKNIKKQMVCSETGCTESRSAALCFHHKPEYEKVGNVSRMAITAEYGIEELKEEIQKCEVICHNCHREKHVNNKYKRENIENHTIDWDSYTEIDMEIDGYRVFRNESSKKCILRNCEYCDQRFMARVDSYNNGQGRFHSSRCAGKFHNGRSKDTKAGLVKTLREEGECSNKDCNESRPCALQFHHINKEEKSENIQQIVDHGNMKDLKSELKKCELLCANCHRVEHSTNT